MTQHYISITGIQVHKGILAKIRFWRLAVPAMRQAQKAQGNISVAARSRGGIHYTLSVWQNEPAMRDYLGVGAHRKAMVAFSAVGTGRTYGFTDDKTPDWDSALQLWHAHAKKIG